MKISKLLKIVLTTAVIIFIVLLFFYIPIEEHLLNYTRTYGFFALILIILITEIVPVPIGGPEFGAVGGSLLNISIANIIILSSVITILASYFNYWIGTRFYPRVCKSKPCQKIMPMFEKYGHYGLFIAAIGPVPYVPFGWTSGAFGMKLRRYLLYGIIPRLIRIVVVTLFFSNILAAIF
ncbi:VTT domain-containing protein [Candidatus Woesearchaeota archaeon]|nr:VTT domain-containing protein [Candidatus Woesearchaeota archaeon]